MEEINSDNSNITSGNSNDVEANYDHVGDNTEGSCDVLNEDQVTEPPHLSSVACSVGDAAKCWDPTKCSDVTFESNTLGRTMYPSKAEQNKGIEPANLTMGWVFDAS